jgi:hypothetical protein
VCCCRRRTKHMVAVFKEDMEALQQKYVIM